MLRHLSRATVVQLQVPIGILDLEEVGAGLGTALDDCLSRSRVHEWFQRFQNGREDINDDEHVGQPKSVITESSIETVREFKKNQPKSSLKFMGIELNISKTSIYRILTEHLG